jgi:Fe-S cluster assembly protein SufD
VFQGAVIVAREAQKTDARQSVDALLLSDDARHDAKPELEIYADDVQCGHGATTGQLDDNALFYLRARGISEADAERLLIAAFLEDGLSEVRHEGLRAALSALAARRLSARSEGTDHA